MSRYTISAIAAIGLIGLAACSEQSTQPKLSPTNKPSLGVGNEMPSGSHYNLNIIGVPKNKTANMDGNTGGRIFVQLNGGDPVDSIQYKQFSDISKVNKILLQSGTDFQVLDANATDSDGALFQLPSNVSTTYYVYARALGTPGGSADMTTCAEDPITGEVICSLTTHTFERTAGKPKTENVTNDLLFMQVNISNLYGTNPGLAECLDEKYGSNTPNVPLFDSCFENYFWNYDNNGLKNLQLRFYPAPVA